MTESSATEKIVLGIILMMFLASACVTRVHANQRPTIDSYSPLTDPTINVGEYQDFSITYSDPDGDPLSVRWYLDGAPSATADSFTVGAGPGSEGVYSVAVRVSDATSYAMHEWTLTIVDAENHDVAVTDVTVSETIVVQGLTVDVNVTVENQGGFTETFNVTVYYNATALGIQEVTLTIGDFTTLMFTWDTTGVAVGDYMISATADTVPSEIDTADNTFTDGLCTVALAEEPSGDINNDGKVDMRDIGQAAAAFGTRPGLPRWDPDADVNGDGKVDMKDIGIIATQFGGT